ncbi:unnamed protein product [Adineta steineri]|uniref:Uncharacterized protein n=2 Tax=Adineta steineri TaxID=433720 RepID=A0A818MQ65_9BILA|nr:unnamed protein product [Adineta steineri]CAF3593239.1 unnamed protein product [Adineta steineri]
MDDNNNSQQSSQSTVSLSLKPGYNIDDIDKANSRFKCIFCKLIIRDPIQLTECGHRSCRNCFDERANKEPDGNVTCPCDDCHIVTNKSQVMPDKAFKKELDNIRVVCIHRRDDQCTWAGHLRDYQAHLDENHVHYICPDCNERFTSQPILDDHMAKCPAIFQLCPLGSLCTDQLIRKTELLKHLLSQKHQEVLIKSVTGEYVITGTMTHEQEMEVNTIKPELDDKTIDKLNTLSIDIQNLNEMNIELTNKFNKLNEHVSTTAQELNNMYLTTNERLPVKQSLQSLQEKVQQDLEQLQQTFDNCQHISTDGTLTWRINNVSEKMADAQSERQTSIFSPVFYSSPTGYKMRARLFLFGDGGGRRSHISLFFLIMKGEYDAILKWPFHYKVTFCLLDQTGNNRHVIDSFHPDVKSNSFQRPKEAANTASGIPKFFPLPMLLQDDNAYVREDTLYLKIIIALNDTPKVLLPFMLTLNPALPNYVQDNLIHQEEIKRQQQQTATVNTPQPVPMNTAK